MDGNFAAMRQSIIDGAPESASALARNGLAQGHHPLELIDNGFVSGMTEVGQLFAKHQMFLPDMLAAAEAMKAAIAVLEPELKRQGEERPVAGTVILGTTKGDIHEIGKTLVGTLLTANGFKVHDLGVDVSPEKFADKARDF
ncbi:MAG: B12-binding domain-containing protein, partial [Acidobacteriaceae bacterium]|nr:B12-binding domain-containing protein [Acidobacteriaceae bacterium]